MKTVIVVPYSETGEYFRLADRIIEAEDNGIVELSPDELALFSDIQFLQVSAEG